MKSQVWIGKKRLKKPLIQGGMGIGVSLSGLAGAVAKEGCGCSVLVKMDCHLSSFTITLKQGQDRKSVV